MAQDAGDQVEEGGQDGQGAGRRAQRRQLGHDVERRRSQLLALVLVRRGRRRPERIVVVFRFFYFCKRMRRPTPSMDTLSNLERWCCPAAGSMAG